MIDLSTHKRMTVPAVMIAAGFLMMAVQGCGDDDDDNRRPTATPVATATATASPTPTEVPDPPHSILRVGSTQQGSGQLAIQGTTVPAAFVVPSACLGGSGHDCIGGVVVYSGTSPGFDDVGPTDATPPFRLPDGIDVRVELVAVDADASLGISGATLDAPGESGLVNQSGHLHNHPMWQTVAPGGQHPAPKHISFRLHADGFTSSEVVTVRLELYEGQDGGGHGHD